jgi:hypothetical protein
LIYFDVSFKQHAQPQRLPVVQFTELARNAEANMVTMKGETTFPALEQNSNDNAPFFLGFF